MAAAPVVFLVLAGGSALAAWQLDRATQQSDFAAFLAHHICGTRLMSFAGK